MAIMQTFPLDNTEYDASALGSWLATRTAGVFSNNGNLDVIANGDMTVTLTSGLCWLKHSEYWGVSSLLSNDYILTIDIADGVLNRIDNIVIRLDKVQNTSYPAIVKGNPATTAVRKPPQRDANVFEIIVATIYVSAGIISLTQSNVMDTRLDETVCGLMRDGVTGIPTNTLYEQAQSLISDLEKAIEDVKGHIIPDGSVSMPKLSTDVQEKIENSTRHTTNQTVHVTQAERTAWNAKQPPLPNIMQTSVAQTMTQQLKAGGTQVEATAQTRNAVILPTGTTDFTSVPVNTLICVKK